MEKVIFWTQAWLLYFFSNQIFLQLVEQEKEYMNQNRRMNIVKIVDKVVKNFTREVNPHELCEE